MNARDESVIAARRRKLILGDVDALAIADGRKTQIRWPVAASHDQPNARGASSQIAQQFKDVAPGDRFWGSEAFRVVELFERTEPGIATRYFALVEYRCDLTQAKVEITAPQFRRQEASRRRGWIAARLMPLWASRFEVVAETVRVEPTWDISEADAIAQGARKFTDLPDAHSGQVYWSVPTPSSVHECLPSAQFAFANDLCKQHSGASDLELWDRNVALCVVRFNVSRSE
ncbi:hypothetical protein [Pararobbsia alpina]|uniref:hypothetical protein n=1 Tax=Pararobbsia alpina TaxID=621374 RepID=UPI0039A40610